MESEQTGLAFSLPPSPERARANSPVKFLPDFQFPSPKARDFVSFGLDDILHTAASDSEDFGPALADALPPSGQEARPSAAYSELVDVLSRATEKLALDWPDEPCESRASKLDDRFLIGAHSKLERRKLPFFSDLHREISSTWKQPFSSRLTNAAAADFTNLLGSVEQGYTAMPVIEDTLASHLSPSLAPSWKSRPLLPSDLRRLNLSLYKGKFKMLTMRTIMSQVQEGDWFVTIDLKDAYFHIQVVQRHRRFLRFVFGGKAYQYKVLPFGLALAPRTFTKCMDAALAPLRLKGHPCTELSGRLAHSGSLQGASESSQGYRSRPHPFSWSQDERQEECAPSISTNRISRSSFGFRSDAGPFGSCPDTSFYSMFGPLQARSSCLCRYLPQTVGPYGSSLPCVAPRAASHEAIPLVDEGAEVTPHCTSYSPYQSVAQLLSTPVNVARPRLSPERGENGCDPPSPYDHDGRINDRLGRGLRRKAGEWRVEGRVPLLAYKLPGTQGCLPGFEVFSPRPRGASYYSQDGQYGGCVPHKPPRRFKVAHPGQACAPSSPLVPRQVPFFEGGSRSGSTEPGGRFSVETEAQARGMDVEPSDGITDLGSVWQSGGGPLCFSGVIPVPALVLPEFPDNSGHRCVRPPMAECQSVRVKILYHYKLKLVSF